MPLSTVQIITVKCPDLASDSNLAIWIALAKEQLDGCFFGSDYNYAIALLACHMYVLGQRPSGESGMVSSKKEGDLSLSYGGFTVQGYLDQTHFGMELKSLIKGSRPAIGVLGAGVTITCDDI